MKFQAFHVNPGEKLKKKDVNNDLSNFMSVFPNIQRHHFSKRIGTLKILLISKFLHSKSENISSGTSLVNDATAVYNFLTQSNIFSNLQMKHQHMKFLLNY